MTTRALLLAACLGLAACPGGGGSGGAPPSADPVLVSLALLPTSLTMEISTSAPITCTGQYSDATSAPVAAAWVQTFGACVSLSAPTGAVETVTGVQAGPCIVQASFGGKTVQITVQVTPANPAGEPGPVYGNDSNGDCIRQYGPLTSPDAGTPLWSPPNNSGAAWGFAVSAVGDYLYAIPSDAIANGKRGVCWFKVADGSSGVLTPAGVSSNCVSLEFDSQGRLVTADYSTGALYRIDTSDGTVTPAGNIGAGAFDIAIGDPGDGKGERVFFCKLTVAQNATWVYQLDPADGLPKAWAVNSVYGDLGVLDFAGGIAMSGPFVFMTTCFDNKVYRFTDPNGNGTPVCSVFATLPFAADNTYASQNIGIDARAGGYAVMVNASPADVAAAGIYFIADGSNGNPLDGVINAGEITKYGTAALDNGRDGGCIRMRK